MLDNISIGYLNGEHQAIENHVTSDILIPRRPFTWGQMFFKPYESTTEYIYSARHTFTAAAFTGLTILCPLVLLAIPFAITAITFTLFALIGISELIESESLFKFAFDVGVYIIEDFCQSLIDVAVLPLSAITMLTRGISTGLQAAGICDYDAVTEEADDELVEDNTATYSAV